MHRSPRSVSSLVEEQVRRFTTEERLRASERATPEPPRPIVTVSRQAGARGTELARLVAARLRFRFWDRELLHDVAARAPASEKLLGEVDERARNVVDDLFAGVLLGDANTEYSYRTELIQFVSAVAKRGSSVVVGRGAQFIVPPEAAFRVRVVGELGDRVRNIGSTRGLSQRDAHRELVRIDRERLAFVRHHYRRDAADPSAYDLVVNSSTFPLDAAADVIVDAYHARFPALAASSPLSLG
jgi:cytidylate kinase